MEQTGNSESCVAVWVAVAVCIRCVLQIYVAVCVADICCSVCCSVCFFAKLATASRVGLEREGKNMFFGTRVGAGPIAQYQSEKTNPVTGNKK